MSRANDGKLTTACIAALRRSYQPTGEVFHLRKAYATAESFARVGLYGDVPKINESLRCAMQREITRGLAARVKPGWYRYLPHARRNRGIPTMTKHRSIKELLRDAPSGRAFVPDVDHPAATAEALIEDNIRSAVALKSKTTEPIKVPANVVRAWKSYHGETGGEEGDIEMVWLRPSQFVANIASNKNPGVGFQRDPRQRLPKLISIAKKFDPRLLGLFHSWVNPAGQDELLDGLGRDFTCLTLLNPPWDEPVLCWRHKHVKNIREAALWFKKLNPDEATKVNISQKFRADLTGRDAHALAMQKEAEIGGLVIGGSGRHGISVQAAEALFKLDVLAETGRVKTSVWGEFKLEGPQWVGLGGYIKATDDNTNSNGKHNGVSMRLIEALTKWGPDKVSQFAHEKYIKVGANTHGRVRAPAFARAILYRRNLRLEVQNRAVADWSLVTSVLSVAPFTDRWSDIAD